MKSLQGAFRISGFTQGPFSTQALAKKYGRKPPVHLLELLRALGETNTLPELKHLFVLVLENRSFDHVFGLLGLKGVDVVTGLGTGIRGIPGQKPAQLDSAGTSFPVVPVDSPSGFELKGDIGHEFRNVKRQLCGADKGGGNYTASGSEIDNSGFVGDFEILLKQRKKEGDDGADGAVNDPMHCYTPSALPVFAALASEFLVCDNWFASVPGPTFPNRMFIHAATSDGITYSPDPLALAIASTIAGFEFENGHIFDRLDEKGLPWYVYVGDRAMNQTVLMHGIGITDLSEFDDLAEDLADPDFDGSYVFIEPDYDPNNDYLDGNSMHPLNPPVKAEALVKKVYETIRKSPAWERSALVITFDEHGGFFDHVPPPHTDAPGDAAQHKPQQGFDFTRLGVRVPTIIVSPLVPKNTIDHTQYDHTSILATLRERFGTKHLTKRDASAESFSHVFRLSKARQDAPMTLPHPAGAKTISMPLQSTQKVPDERPMSALPDSTRTFLLAAAVADSKMRGAGSEPAVVADLLSRQTVGDARRYIAEVRARVALRPRIRRPPLQSKKSQN